MRHPPSPQAACRMRKLSLQIHLCLIDTLFKNAKVSHFVASCRTTPTLHHLRRIHSKTAILFLPAPAPPLSLYPPSSIFAPVPPTGFWLLAPGSGLLAPLCQPPTAYCLPPTAPNTSYPTTDTAPP